MINREEYFLLLAAPSTHYVMKLEKDLQNYGIWCKIIPLPGEISAGCGLSIRYNLELSNTIIEKKNEIGRAHV